MKKSRVEDIFKEYDNPNIERSSETDTEAHLGIDDIEQVVKDRSRKNRARGKAADVLVEDSAEDLTDKFEEKPAVNPIVAKIGQWYQSRVAKRRNRRRGKSKLRRICAILVVSLTISFIVISVWNSLQMKQVNQIVASIDDSYSVQELNIDKVTQLGNLFTIHDTASFNWVMDNIDMTYDLKSTLFSADENGNFSYTGTENKAGVVPTYQCLEVQYEQGENPLSYLANFKVTMANGNVRYYLVLCKFRLDENNKYVLSKFHAY